MSFNSYIHDPSYVRSASNGILLCCYQTLKDIDCAGCNRGIRTGDYEGHECVPSLTPEEKKQAAELLKRTISTSPDKGVVQLATGGAAKEVFDWYRGYIIFTLTLVNDKSPKPSNKPQPPDQAPDALKCRE